MQNEILKHYCAKTDAHLGEALQGDYHHAPSCKASTFFRGVPAGEAQKIDRIMERFAERYCKDNPDVFKTSDGAYLLSFALIMLNTDAHNPMADKKLSLDDFVSMCQYQVLYCCALLLLYKVQPCMSKLSLFA